MKKTILFLLISLLSMQMLWSQEGAEKAFPQYTWIDASAADKDGSRFGYDKNTFTPVNKRCEALPKTDACYLSDNEDDYVLIGRYKNASMKEPVNILYSPGPSGDPHFVIINSQNIEIWGSAANEMCINAAGIIYISGHSNKMFDERRKLQFANGKVTEIKQPFCYVGVKGKLLKPVTLYSQKSGGVAVATLPVGYEIEVLLAEEDYTKDGEDGYGMPKNFLARSAFGLVGWLRLTDDDTYYMDPVIRGLGYSGD